MDQMVIFVGATLACLAIAQATNGFVTYKAFKNSQRAIIMIQKGPEMAGTAFLQLNNKIIGWVRVDICTGPEYHLMVSKPEMHAIVLSAFNRAFDFMGEDIENLYRSH